MVSAAVFALVGGPRPPGQQAANLVASEDAPCARMPHRNRKAVGICPG